MQSLYISNSKMKRFIRDIVCVAAILSCFFVFAEVKMKGQRNLYTIKYQYIQHHKDDISTLVLGHSHIEGAVMPSLIDSAYNFAIAGRWIYYDMHLAKRLIPLMSNLKVVIFPMTYDAPWGFLSPRYAFDDYKEELVIYEKYMDIPYDRFPYNVLCHSALLNGMMHISRFQDENSGRDSLGFDPRGGQLHSSDNWKNSSSVHVSEIGSAELMDNVTEYLSFLKEIAHVCAENNVQFVVVTTPCYEVYVNQTNEEGIQTLYGIIDSIKAYYPVEYHNYLNDDAFRTDTFYYDCSHLNYVGAKPFTLRLKEDLGL